MELPADLVDQIARAPRDPAPYLVAADFLQQHGDPWGELIAVAHAHDRAADPAAWRAELERCQRAIDGFAGSAYYRADWHRGVVHRITYVAWPDRSAATELRDLLASPIARLVRELIVVDRGAGLAAMLATVLAARVPALRALRLISDDGRDRLVIDRLAARLPHLERLQLDGVVAGTLDHPRLRTVELRAPQPALTYLELPELERLSWPVHPALDELANKPRRFPALRRLAVTATTSAEAAAAERTVMDSVLGVDLAELELRVASEGVIVARRFALALHVVRSPHAALISSSGSHRYTVQPIHAPFTLGTHHDASLVVAGRDVATHAATLEYGRDARWHLRGHPSMFKPRLDGVPVLDALLGSGDELAIGLERYRFVELGDDPRGRAAVIAEMIDAD